VVLSVVVAALVRVLLIYSSISGINLLGTAQRASELGLGCDPVNPIMSSIVREPAAVPSSQTFTVKRMFSFPCCTWDRDGD
jgi:hypothetical protein